MTTTACYGPTGRCQRTAPCEHACALRMQSERPSTPVGWSDSDWIGSLQYQAGKQAGWDECMDAWAKHMAGMAKAIKAARKDAQP